MSPTTIEDAESPAAQIVGRGRGTVADTTFRGLALVAGASVLAILALIAITTTQKGWPAFHQLGAKYWFGTTWAPKSGKYGIVPLVYGTLVVALIAVTFALPLSLGIALFVTEMVPRRFKSTTTTIMDVLAAVPSVVFGLWGFRILAPKMKGVYGSINGVVGGVPGLGRVFGEPSGRGFMTAGLVVALMIIPIITAVTREVFATVPRNDKEGALALGATRWEMIRGVVLPHSTAGIAGAVMLGVGRALGETIAVALLIGGTAQISLNLFGTGETMPAQIARQLGEAGPLFRSALIGLGVVLFIVTITVNATARGVVRVLDRRLKGA
jgi:phosphate transport system permease protein